MQGQKGKCKDDIKSYSFDRFEQVERSKTCGLYCRVVYTAERFVLQETFLSIKNLRFINESSFKSRAGYNSAYGRLTLGLVSLVIASIMSDNKKNNTYFLRI